MKPSASNRNRVPFYHNYCKNTAIHLKIKLLSAFQLLFDILSTNYSIRKLFFQSTSRYPRVNTWCIYNNKGGSKPVCITSQLYPHVKNEIAILKNMTLLHAQYPYIRPNGLWNTLFLTFFYKHFIRFCMCLKCSPLNSISPVFLSLWSPFNSSQNDTNLLVSINWTCSRMRQFLW